MSISDDIFDVKFALENLLSNHQEAYSEIFDRIVKHLEKVETELGHWWELNAAFETMRNMVDELRTDKLPRG